MSTTRRTAPSMVENDRTSGGAHSPGGAEHCEVLWTERQVAPHLGVTVRALQSWRLTGGGPPYVKIGRSVRYRPSDIKRFVDERVRRTTSDEAAR